MKFVDSRVPLSMAALTTHSLAFGSSHLSSSVEIVRAATKIVESVLANTRAFQYLAILHEDRVTGIRNKKREFGYQIEVRCWDSATDAVTGTPTRLGWPTLEKLAQRITRGVPGVVSVTYNITRKPPSTIEAV